MNTVLSRRRPADAAALPAPQASMALECAAPERIWHEAANDGLRRRLDLMSMSAGERQAAVNALILGRDIGNLLLRLARMMPRLSGASNQRHRSPWSSSYGNLFRTRRERSSRRAPHSRVVRSGLE